MAHLATERIQCPFRNSLITKSLNPQNAARHHNSPRRRHRPRSNGTSSSRVAIRSRSLRPSTPASREINRRCRAQSCKGSRAARYFGLLSLVIRRPVRRGRNPRVRQKSRSSSPRSRLASHPTRTGRLRKSPPRCLLSRARGFFPIARRAGPRHRHPDCP